MITAMTTAPEARSATRAATASVDSIGGPPEEGRGLALAADALAEALALAGATLEAASMGTAAFPEGALADTLAVAVLLALDGAVAVADADPSCACAALVANTSKTTVQAAHNRAAIHLGFSRAGGLPSHRSSALVIHITSRSVVFRFLRSTCRGAPTLVCLCDFSAVRGG